ncbi:BA14K family protein [Rhodopseudomonas telluris]|uniref:Lectin-like protein BA14k n=1 Tax=Rhodopseudomonas telluris TaxID=644215 RepID=A0ABV6EXA0_9BRAD
MTGTGLQRSKARKLISRTLASGLLLGMYAFGLITTTGAMMAASTTPAQAWRGRGRGRGRGWGGDAGAAVGIGIGAAILGGAIAASAAEQSRRQDAINYCASRYRSFNPETMTYIGKDGRARPCP